LESIEGGIMTKVPFVITEQNDDGDWELAELEPEAELQQLEVLLGKPASTEVQESNELSGRQKAMLERWKDYP
jgi:hypothetical protein